MHTLKTRAYLFLTCLTLALGSALTVSHFKSSADATALAPFIDLQEAGLTMVQDGEGLLNWDHTTPVNLNVNVGGAVRFALLYWNGRDRPCTYNGSTCTFSQPFKDQQVTFNGTPITGTVIGTETQPGPAGSETLNIGYFADVTSLVSAAGTGNKTFTFTDGNGASNLWRLNGVTLMVAYTNAADPKFYRVLIWDNLDYAYGDDPTPGETRVTSPVTFGHGAITASRPAQLFLVLGGGTAARPDEVTISNNPTRFNAADAAAGPAWDSESYSINIPANVGTTTVQVNSAPAGQNPDELLWQVAALRVPLDAPPTCTQTLVSGPPAQVIHTIRDADSGLVSIVVTKSQNADTVVPPFIPGTTEPVIVTSTKIDQSKPMCVMMSITDEIGNVSSCNYCEGLNASKSFGAPNIPLNGTTSLSFTLSNPTGSGVDFTNVSFTDTLPLGLEVTTPNGLTGSCGSGTITATAGSSTITLSGATLAANSSCTFSVNVIGTSSGSKTNSVTVTSDQGANPTATATLQVSPVPTIAKSFSPNPIAVGGVSTLTFTVTNPNVGTALTGVAFTDSFPAGLEVAATPNATTTGCGSPTFAPAAGNTSVNFSDGTIAASGSCTVTVNVTPTTAGAKVNTTGNVTSTNGGTGNTATATLTTVAPPTIGKTFNPTSIPLNGTSTITFTITNPAANTVALTVVSFTDTLPTGVQVAATPNVVGACGGAVTATAGSGTISLMGGSIATNASCTIMVNVTGTTVGTKNNSVQVTSSNGGTGNTAMASLDVVAPPTIAKMFNPTTINPGAISQLTLTFSNPAGNFTLTNLAITDNLAPADLSIAATPGLTNTCGGTVTGATAGSTSFSLSGGSLAAGATCQVQVNITRSTGGAAVNTTGNVTATGSGINVTGGTATATLNVNPPQPPTIGKAFGASSIALGGTTSLTLTINNPNPSLGLTGVAFTDTLPAGLVVATPNALVNTCGGTATATAGSGSVSLAGGAVAANGACTVSVNVTGTTPGTKPNSVQVTSSNGGTGNTATATVTVGNAAFTVSIADPFACTGPGEALTVTVITSNPTLIAQTVSFTTTLPGGLIGVPGSGTTTVGTPPTVTASGATYTATLAAGQSVTVTYQVQVGDATSGTRFCTLTTLAFAGQPSGTVQACATVTCPALGPGLPFPSTSPVNDQKPGSVLIYPVYTSDAANGASQNARLTITNTHPARSANVHLFFVDGSSCSVADSFICLTANQTASVLASDIDPGTTGYLIAIASDRAGCPINFNYLIGDEFVKFSSGHAANLGAEAVAAIAGGLPACDANIATTATLNFDGVSYNYLPRVLASSNLQSRADGNDTLLIVDRIGGSLLSGAATINGLFGLLYDDAEKGVSFQIAAPRCQFRASLNNDLRTTPRYESIITNGRTGWMKIWSTIDAGIIGAQINRNSNAASNSGAFNGGHNLHKLTLTSGSVTIPIFPPLC